MDGEGVEITVAPNAVYVAKDLLIEREFEGHHEGLVKWVRLKPQGKLSTEERRELEHISTEYSLWMRKDEIEACCPRILSLTPSQAGGSSSGSKMSWESSSSSAASKDQPKTSSSSASFSSSTSSSSEKDEVFLEMRDEVRLLISRAKKLMARERGNNPPSLAAGKVLTSTINILNAYAKIGSLANTFQEYGALDLLLGWLRSADEDIRKNSSDMLGSLTTFDLSTRSYVLLQLLKDDESSGSTLQSRQMLLDLFSKTASSDESLLKEVAFPHVCLWKDVEREKRKHLISLCFRFQHATFFQF